MVEPIQGEGGVRIPSEDYLRGVRKICDEKKILLILDEVQVGMGRTGPLFAHEDYGIKPDIMTLAKAMGNGFPVGALLATEEVADAFLPGTHASTFGGNPWPMAAAVATLQTLLYDGVLETAGRGGLFFRRALSSLKARFPFIEEVRGKGLILGVELNIDGQEIVDRCLEKGLLINCTAGNILRFVPPLTITKVEVDKGLDIIEGVLREVSGR